MLILTVSVLISVIGVSRYKDFVQYHEVIAQESVKSLSHDITNFIIERERLVTLFGESNYDLIEKIITNPHDESSEEKLRAEAKHFFPSYFSLSIADEKGNRYLEDFDGLMGGMCIADIRAYAKNFKNSPRVHPHLDAYHFDIMSKIKVGNKEIILFISFHADLLAKSVYAAQVSGHQLLLTYPAGNGLIEITAKGPRNILQRDNFILTDLEASRSIIKSKIAGTSWYAEDFYLPSLYATQRNNIVTEFSLIYILFIIACVVMLIVLKREENRRIFAERHKQEFILSIGHELRTPLTAISGSISLVANGVTGEITDKTQEIINIAQGNCARLIHLITDLLDLNKVEAGKMHYDKKEIIIYDVVSTAIDASKQFSEQHNVSFAPMTSSDAFDNFNIYVNADENRVIQVLVNLLSNSTKYGADRDIIEIDLKKIKGSVMIKIIDHGDGVPEDLETTLFDKFARSEKHVNSNIEGNGLGLNISKNIMDEHNGSIGYHSTKGHTYFFISLPITKIEKK